MYGVSAEEEMVIWAMLSSGETISPSICRFVFKDRSSMSPTSVVTFQRETTAAIFISSLCCLMLTFWAVREQAEQQMGAFLYTTGIVTPLPNPLLFCLERMMHCFILLRHLTWSTVKHTGNTTSNSLPGLWNNTWKLNMVQYEGKS